MKTLKIVIYEHSGDKYITSIKSYNAAQTFKQVRDAQSANNQDHAVLIGDVIIDARRIKLVALSDEE